MLRQQATDIGVSASSIPGVRQSTLQSTIRNLDFAALKLREVGVDFAGHFKARFNRLKFESDINASRKNIKDSNRLFEADRYMRRNPWRYDTATQRISAVDRLRELTHPFASKMERYRELYGGDAETIQRTEADEAYRSYIKGIKDPIGSKRDALKERFGGGSRGNILAINAMTAEANESYRRDMLSSFDSKIEDLTERYGGGTIGRNRAYDVLFKNIPFLKPIAKSLPFIARPLANIAAHPIASMGAGALALQSLDNKIGTAAKSSTNREILSAAIGSPSDELMSIATAIGEVDSIYQRRRKMMSIFGDADYGYKTIGNTLKGVDDFTRIKLMEAYGIDETDAFIAMQMATPPENRVMSAAQKRARAQELVRLETEYGFSGHGGWGDFFQSILNSLPLGETARRKDYEDFDYVREHVDKQFDEYMKKTKEAGENANQSSSLPLQSMITPEPSSSQSDVQLAFNIGTVDVTADNPLQLADELMGVAESKSNYAYALAFGSGRAA